MLEEWRSHGPEAARPALLEIIEQGVCPQSVAYFGQLFPGQILVGEGTDERGGYWELHHVPLTIPPQAPGVYTVRLKKDRLGTSKENPQGDRLNREQWVAQVQKGTYGAYQPGCAPLHSGVALALLQNEYHPVQSQRTRICDVWKFLLSHYRADFFSTMTCIAPYAAQGERDTVVHDVHLDFPSIVEADIKGPNGYLLEDSLHNFNTHVFGQSEGQARGAWHHVTGLAPYAWRPNQEPTTPSKERDVLVGHIFDGRSHIIADGHIPDGTSIECGRALGWMQSAQNFSP